MTKQEVLEKFTLELLEAVATCDKKMQAAYEERQLTLQELDEWILKNWQEACDGG